MGKKERQQEREANRLVGWLVSYQNNSQGDYYEIRTGRRIIGASQVADEKTIVIKENTISNLHAAINANLNNELIIQDLFSDYGTFVTKKGTSKEAKIEAPTKLEHGDWIKLGDKARYQICLINCG
ncbi:MAG TPA: FHA domain-containing protein [Oligoflexia bacterium]|nr:FHA domain-containing protein [Oligoflexia bacterium]HMP27465.1 FHA domain-containing protein [Oligoflexia bacterium]